MNGQLQYTYLRMTTLLCKVNILSMQRLHTMYCQTVLCVLQYCMSTLKNCSLFFAWKPYRNKRMISKFSTLSITKAKFNVTHLHNFALLLHKCVKQLSSPCCVQAFFNGFLRFPQWIQVQRFFFLWVDDLQLLGK